MSTWQPLARRFANCDTRNDAQQLLRRAGYRLVTDPDAGGVWLVGKHGSTWYSHWRAAVADVRAGTAALGRMGK